MKEDSTGRIEIPVTIVGGGLSGLALSREYTQRGIEHVVFEASPRGKNRAIHYLTSKDSATSLGLSDKYEEALKTREPITGYTLYDGKKDGLVPLESISPNKKTRDGFVTFSIAQIRDWLAEEGLPIERGKSVNKIERLDTNKLLVKTSTGDEYTTQVVVDATGARVKALQLAKTASPQLIGDRLVRYCYGGVFPYFGPEDQLLFVDKFPSVNTSQEGAGWVMPLGENMAEVVVAWEGALKDKNAWHTSELPKLLSSYIEWFNSRGIEINPDGKTEVISGVYSEGLLDYRKLPITPGVIAFGEAIGLNHPANGYLINKIAQYAKIMAEETEGYLSTNKWQPYERLIGESPINYGLQHSHARRKIRANVSGEGRFTATGRLQNFLVASLGEDGFWALIDRKLPLDKILIGAIKHPQYIKEILTVSFLYVKELFRNRHLYLSELGLKIKAIATKNK